MQAICGLLAWVFIAIVVWLGASRNPLWVPLVAAIGGFLLYLGIKGPVVIVGLLQRQGMMSFTAMVYGTQVILAFLLYGVGYAISFAIR